MFAKFCEGKNFFEEIDKFYKISFSKSEIEFFFPIFWDYRNHILLQHMLHTHTL